MDISQFSQVEVYKVKGHGVMGGRPFNVKPTEPHNSSGLKIVIEYLASKLQLTDESLFNSVMS